MTAPVPGGGLARLLCVAAGWAMVGACTGEGGGGRFSGPPRTGDTIPVTRTVDGAEVPWFAAARLGGGDTVTVADLRGSPVLLNLWATWCPPCRHETPYLETIAERWGGRLRVVGVTVDNRGSEQLARSFLEQAGADYEQLHDPAMTAMDLFGAPGLPATFLIDAEGLVTFSRLGPVMEGDRDFESAIEELAGPPESASGPGGDPGAAGTES